MEHVRVLLANRPRLLREMVLSTLAEQPDIDVVGEVEEANDISDCIERTNPDFVLIGLEDGEKRPEECDLLLNRYPQLRIIAVAEHRTMGFLYWATMDIQWTAIEATGKGLLNALRGNTGSPTRRFS